MPFRLNLSLHPPVWQYSMPWLHYQLRPQRIYLHALKCRLVQCVETMLRDVDKQMKTAQHCFQGYHYKMTPIGQEPLYHGQYVYIDHPPVKTSATERLVTTIHTINQCPQNRPIQNVLNFAKYSNPQGRLYFKYGSNRLETLTQTWITFRTYWTMPTVAKRTNFWQTPRKRTYIRQLHRSRPGYSKNPDSHHAIDNTLDSWKATDRNILQFWNLKKKLQPKECNLKESSMQECYSKERYA